MNNSKIKTILMSKSTTGFTQLVDFGFVFEIVKNNFHRLFCKVDKSITLDFFKSKTIKISKPKFTTGFTLIELLMVISIISLLSTVIFNFTNETRAKARDSVRLSDMKQIGIAMQMHYQDTGAIPASFDDLVNGGYLPSIPLDPGTHLQYNFTSTTKTAVVSASYENQYINETDKKSVSVAIGDTDISTLCGEGFDLNCSEDDSPLDQIVFISPGITYGGGGGSSSPTTPTIPESSISISVSSSTVQYEDTVVIGWIPSNMTSCTASGGSTGWAGVKDAFDGVHTWTSGILTTGTYTYNISCTNGTQTIPKAVTVTVSAPPLIPSVDFSVSSSTVMSGNTAILSWTTLNMTSCTASGGSTGWAGVKDAFDGVHTWTTDALLTGTYTYNISCTNGTQTIPRDVTVSVVPFAGGEGTLVNPYQISNWSQLNEVRNYLDKSFILTTNLSSATIYYYDYAGEWPWWNPIGTDTNQFTGSFNGNGKTISDLIINKPGVNYIGLFGSVTGNISNVGLINMNVIGLSYVGGLIGSQNGGTISNSYSTGGVVGRSSSIGGLVGLSYGIISNSHTAVTVIGQNNVGGLVGWQGAGSITNSYSTGNVSVDDGSTSNGVGGLVGIQRGTISNSYSIVNVTGKVRVGGLVGYQYATIINSYSAGRVTGSSSAGGLVGARYSGSTSYSFWNRTASNQTTSGSGTEKTETQMKTRATYMNNGYDYTNGWDLNIWNIVDGSYPTLKP